MDLLRHGAMPGLFGGIRALSTLGSHLRSFTCGSVLQLEMISPLLLGEVARRARRCCPAGTRWPKLISTLCNQGVQALQAGRRVRPHEDPGQEPAGARAERAGRRHFRAAGRVGASSSMDAKQSVTISRETAGRSSSASQPRPSPVQ